MNLQQITCIIFILIPTSLFAQIYKYQDERGKWHYTDKAPANSKASSLQQMEINPADNDKPPPQSQALQQKQSISSTPGSTSQAESMNINEGAARIMQIHEEIERMTGLRLFSSFQPKDDFTSSHQIEYPMISDYQTLIPAMEAILEAAKPYSPRMFKYAQLLDIKLGRRLRNKQVGKLAGWASRKDHTIYMNFEARPSHINLTFHHEVFHMLDISLLFHKKTSDEEWQALNPRGFAYKLSNFGYETSVGAMRRQDDGHPHHGFISRYGMINVREDKAELFEALTSSKQRPYVMALAKEDRYIRSKVVYLYNMLNQIDPQFWKRLDPQLNRKIAMLQ